MTDQNFPHQPGAPVDPSGAAPPQNSSVRTYPDGAKSVGGGSPLDFLTEGWGAGKMPSFEQLKERFGLVWRRARGPVLFAWFALALVPIALLLLRALLESIGAFSASVRLTVLPINFVLYVLWMIVLPLVTYAQLSLFKPLHQRVFETPHEPDAFMGAIKSGGSVLLMTVLVMLVMNLGASLGGVCCVIPGIIIGVLFCQAPYLVAARGREFADAFTESARLNKAYWQSLLYLFGATCVLAVVIFVARLFFGVGLAFVAGLVSRPLGVVGSSIGNVIVHLIVEAGLFGIFLVQMTIFSSVETQDTGRLPAADV